MEVLNWKFKKVTWTAAVEQHSKVGWSTRLIVLACVLAMAFSIWVLPTEFANENRLLTWAFVGLFLVLTIYRVAEFSNRYDWGCESYPRIYKLGRAFCITGNLRQWLGHKLIPFGYRQRAAKKAYGTYGFLALLLLAVYSYTTIQPWLAERAQWLAERALPVALSVGGVTLTFILVCFVITLVTDYRRRRWMRHFKKTEAADREREKMIGDIKKQAAEELAVKIEQWGDMVALAIILLKRVPPKRGDGNIGEARIVLEYVLEEILIPDEIRRQAALFRADEQLAAPERQRFQRPPRPQVV